MIRDDGNKGKNGNSRKEYAAIKSGDVHEMATQFKNHFCQQSATQKACRCDDLNRSRNYNLQKRGKVLKAFDQAIFARQFNCYFTNLTSTAQISKTIHFWP
jgi:hypothetical protein